VEERRLSEIRKTSSKGEIKESGMKTSNRYFGQGGELFASKPEGGGDIVYSKVER
jgi:hypothetical protein